MKLKLDANVLDFADPRLCPPAQFAGLVVMRLGAPTARNRIAAHSRFFATTADIAGRLWIVEHTRARPWTPQSCAPPRDRRAGTADLSREEGNREAARRIR